MDNKQRYKYLFLVMMIGLSNVLDMNFLRAQELSFDYKKEVGFADIVQRQKVGDSITLEKIVIEGYDSKVPFYHFENRQTSSRNYVVLLHGLGDSKESWLYPSMPYLDWSSDLTALKDSLLYYGFSLIIPDAKFHGERTYELGFRPPQSLPPQLSQSLDDAKKFTLMSAGSIVDVSKLIDYIDQRYGKGQASYSIIGYSFGGALGIILNAVDNRLSSLVACVPPLHHPEKEAIALRWNDEIINELASVTPGNYAKRQKSPVLLLLGENDFFYSKEEVQKFCDSRPSRVRKEARYYPAGHILPGEYIIDAVEWIRLHAMN